jgi:hypothetical protein
MSDVDPGGFAEPQEGEDLIPDGHAVFDGDDGALTFPQRICLITLLKRHYITAAAHPSEWRTLIADEQLIKSRLNDLLLDLRVDRDLEVAYKVQVRSEEERRFPPLLQATRFRREETLLLVFLRSRYRSDRQAGEQRVYVDREEMLEHVGRFRPAAATDITGDLGRADRAVTRLAEYQLLLPTTGAVRDEETRFEIAPIIEPLLPVERLRQVVDQLAAKNSGETQEDDEIDQEDDGEEAA